jgi:CheY-like chemotaxis protein
MGNRLLLADDSITIQKVVAIIFANEEFELTVVDNGNAALEKARELRPDVMLVDALMPGKTGYEVCTEIRRDPNLGSVPILLLIGAFEPLDEQKARDCGADASISKPFESQQLIDKVKELLEMGKSRAAAPVPAAAPTVSAAQVPPAATPLPLEAAAEELWGDLSAFDTMPPVTEPAAFTAPGPPAAPAAPQPAPQPTFTAPAAPAPAAAPTAAPKQAAPAAAPQQAAPTYAAQAAAAPPVAEEIVEASYEDDLWGAFDLEEIPASGGASESFGVLEPDAEYEAEEFFSFEEEESDEIAETGPAIENGSFEEEPVVQPSAEELFSFEEVPLEEVAEPEPAKAPEQAYDAFAFEPEPAPAAAAPAAAAAAPAVEEAWEPPVMEPQGVPAWAPAPEVVPAQPHAAPAISEADLAAAISRISREVIEKIVWEVVPDLAEILIKEEIRKLRAGVRD